MPTRLSIERRITAGFGLAAVVIAGIAAISYTTAERASADAAMERRAHEAEAHLNRIMSLAADAEAATLTFLITGKEEVLAPLRDSDRWIGEETAALRALIVDHGQRRNIAPLIDLLRKRMESLRRLSTGRRAAVDDRTGVLLRQHVDAMLQRERQILNERQETTLASQRLLLRVVMAVGLATVVLIGVAVAVLLRQLHARERSEAALHATTERLRKVFEFSLDAICAIDAEGRFVQVSPACRRLWGYAPHEMLGRRYIEMVLPEDRAKSERAREAFMAGESTTSFENRYLRKDGSVAHIMWSAQWSDAEQIMFCIARDVSEQQRLREELVRARDRAVAADRVKSAFLATMSHELRTPLNSIIGFTGLLMQGLAGPLNEEQARQLDMVRSSARHLLDLINDILDISKIEAGELRVESAPFDLRSSIERVTGLIRPLAQKKGLMLRVDVAPDIGPLVSDRRRVEQVLLNLMNNAVKFTERGEIALAADRSRTQPGALRLRVSDTGIGITPEEMTSLFQPFRQIDSTLSRIHEGTGLGLAICRRLAELMGGEVRAESDLGKGSTFTLTLPLNEPVPS